MVFGCIDIGSNTTRLLVADASGGSLRELIARRAFTRIGRSLGTSGRVPAEKVTEIALVVGAQARAAREVGAHALTTVATAAIRDAANRDELVARIEAELGGPLRVLSAEEEARLCFLGATRTFTEPAQGAVAVADVGGGSTEMAIGSPGGEVEWWRSFGVGSGMLADRYLCSDPPSAAELEAARSHVASIFEGVRAPPAHEAVAVGGTATSLRRLVGAGLSTEALERGVRALCATPAAAAAERFGLDPERVRLLPAGMLVLGAVSRCLGLPLRVADGGLREGAILELMRADESGEV